MKKAFLILGILLFVNLIAFGQESGNRIYGNQGYAQTKRNPTTNSGNLLVNGGFSIETSVLLNLKPDSFVAVFAVQQDAKVAAESNDKVNLRIDEFLKNLSGLGITKNDIYVDFITQNKVFDFSVSGDIAQENLTGFETKKTVAVKYKNRDSFEKIITAATTAQIFDLIKVDYIVSDFESAREKLFDEAVKVIKKKELKYKDSLGMTIKSIGLAVEKYEAFYPAERYESYKAFESGAVSSPSYGNNKTFVYLRKGSTFFYEPLNETNFDRVINAIGLEPTVQFTIYLQVRYNQI